MGLYKWSFNNTNVWTQAALSNIGPKPVIYDIKTLRLSQRKEDYFDLRNDHSHRWQTSCMLENIRWCICVRVRVRALVYVVIINEMLWNWKLWFN